MTDNNTPTGRKQTDGAIRTDGLGSGYSFNEVCDECGRHVVKAGHDPDCSNAEDSEQRTQTEPEDAGTDAGVIDTDEPQPEAVTAIQNARSLLRDFEEVSVEERHGVIKHAIDELENAQRRLPDDY
jgi:hypothetical protein